MGIYRAEFGLLKKNNGGDGDADRRLETVSDKGPSDRSVAVVWLASIE